MPVRTRTRGAHSGQRYPVNIESAIARIEKQIREGRVGTPNVYVRLGELRREQFRRSHTPTEIDCPGCGAVAGFCTTCGECTECDYRGISSNNPPVGTLGHERYTCALCGQGIVQGTETGFDDEFICPSCARQVERDEKSGAIARDTKDD